MKKYHPVLELDSKYYYIIDGMMMML